MNRDERRDALEAAVDRLREEAEAGTVVVEGARDLAALEWLGIGGQHVQIHQGRPLQALVEDLAMAPPPVILLLDWDRTGGTLVKRLEAGLRGRVHVNLDNRRRLASCCHARCLEDVPAELSSLRSS